MGWTVTNKPRGKPLTAWFIEDEGMFPAAKYKVLDSAYVACSEYYAAVESVRDGKREVWCATFLVRCFRPDRDGYNISYKDMEESMGPYMYRCPERILDLLTPTDNVSANEWRAKCRVSIAARKAVPKLSPGAVITAATPIRFRDGSEQTSLTVRECRGNRVSFVGGYRVSKQWISNALAEARITVAAAQ